MKNFFLFFLFFSFAIEARESFLDLNKDKNDLSHISKKEALGLLSIYTGSAFNGGGDYMSMEYMDQIAWEVLRLM